MSEKGILMSSPMVTAELAGLKHQTRQTSGLEEINVECNKWKLVSFENGVAKFAYMYERGDGNYITVTREVKSRYQVGDLLYWKENYYIYGYWYVVDASPKRWSFRGTNRIRYMDNPPENIAVTKGGPTGYYKRPSLFMFQEHARIWTPVVKVEAQRVQEITAEDCEAEGVSFKHSHYYDVDSGMSMPEQNKRNWLRIAYMGLWDSINGIGSWKSNPWVFKYTLGDRIDRRMRAK